MINFRMLRNVYSGSFYFLSCRVAVLTLLVFMAIVTFSTASVAEDTAGQSFSDLAEQVQTAQQACEKDNKYGSSCIAKLSSSYAALYDAASSSQSINESNPLAALARNQLQQYRGIRSFIESHALELMNGSTTIPDDLLKNAIPSTEAAPAGTAPPSTVAAPSDAPPVDAPAKPTTEGNGEESGEGKNVANDQESPAQEAAPTGRAIPTVRPPDLYKISPTDQPIIATANSDCASAKNKPSLLGTPVDGQDKLAGCTDYEVNDAPFRLAIGIAEANKSLDGKCSSNSNDFSTIVGPVSVALDPNKKYGSFYWETPKLKEGEQICLLELLEGHVAASSSPVTVKSAFKDMAPLAEALVGVDVSAASSTSPQAVLLALGTFDIPLQKITAFSTAKTPQQRLLWLSGQLGLKGMAQPGAISGASSAGYYASAINATPDKIVQSVDVSQHLGFQFYAWHMPTGTGMGTFDSGNPADSRKPGAFGTLSTLSFIAGGGAITPLSPSQASPQVFEATPEILQTQIPYNPPTNTFPTTCSQTPSTQCYVIFLPSDRTHFYRYYDAGLRLKLYPTDYTDNELRFPAILNFTIGQNEYVTGGKLHGTVLHTGGSLPIPKIDGFYLFGDFDLGLSSKNGGGPELQLIPAPATAGVTPTSPSVYTIFTSQPNRDRYQIGFGIDVFHLFPKLLKSNNQTGGQDTQNK